MKARIESRIKRLERNEEFFNKTISEIRADIVNIYKILKKILDK